MRVLGWAGGFMDSSWECVCPVDGFGGAVEYRRMIRSLSGISDDLFSKTVSDVGVLLDPELESNIESRLMDTGLRASFFFTGERALSRVECGAGLLTGRIRDPPGKLGLFELFRLNRKFSLALFAA